MLLTSTAPARSPALNARGVVQPLRGKMIDCPPHLLEPKDIIRQDYRDGNGNPQTTLYEVIHNWGKVGRDYKLELKNLTTEEIKSFMWGGSDQTLCAGPKVEAYQKNPALCSKAKISGYPQWNAQFAATG